MESQFLYDKLLTEFGKQTIEKIELPQYITQNLNPKFQIRDYQLKAFQRFICYQENSFDFKNIPIHLLFNMATGSGKTLIMAGLILYLHQKGYRNFLFFVNSNNILEKTKDNFLNQNSSKYLFNNKISFSGKECVINEVNNFSESRAEDINIFFTTIQGLHQDLTRLQKENSITFQDFEDKEIVLLSDEAHHLNVGTKRLTKKEKELKQNWETTVNEIFNSSAKNLLLEFTATVDLSNSAILEKYKDKIIYKYDLLNFRKDKFSKEIKTLSLDSSLEQVMLHAVLLSQYRLKIAEKNKIFLKPVILFKAQKTIEQSNKNEQDFKRLIDELNPTHLEKLFAINYSPTENSDLVAAFSYFEKIYNGNYQNLIAEIQQDFSDEKILNVNDGTKNSTKKKEDTKRKPQDVSNLLLDLESKQNPIRAIFAVNKLNEGWDVLNLFDIVRIYNTRDGNWQKNGKYKPGATTLSEAQLIGRGARYYPFAINKGEDIFKRKYDEYPDKELKILEELHYHSKYNSEYLAELERALIEQGLVDEKDKIEKLQIKIKENEKDFYDNKLIFKNDWIPNKNKDKTSFKNYQISDTFSFTVDTDEITEKTVFENQQNLQPTSKIYRIPLKDIHPRIFYKAFNQNKDFWVFSNVKKYFGELQSMKNLLSEQFFYGIQIECNKKELTNKEKLDCLNELLNSVSQIITKNAKSRLGSEEFKPYPVSKLFDMVKELKFNKTNSQFKEIDITQIKDYFLHDRLIGTSEEANFIKFFEGYLEELKAKYQEVKLLRNNRELKLYRFDDGEAFEPDFILFLTKNNGQQISYQVFIEPKGDHLLEYDKEKEIFLEQIKKKYILEGLTAIKNNYKLKEIPYDEDSYKLLGLRFYNKDKENKFRENFEEELLK